MKFKHAIAGFLLSVSPLFGQTFEQAKANPLLRQAHLNGLVAQKEEKGTGYWKYLDSIVYDPGLVRCRSYMASMGNTMTANAYGNEHTRSAAATPFTTPGALGVTFITDAAYAFDREDDLLSIIDNETSHLKDNEDGDVSSLLLPQLALELKSSDYQLHHIIYGKRKVSQEALYQFRAGAADIVRRLEKYANHPSSKHLMHDILAATKKRPTWDLMDPDKLHLKINFIR